MSSPPDRLDAPPGSVPPEPAPAEARLDEALDESFPASDPPSLQGFD